MNRLLLICLILSFSLPTFSQKKKELEQTIENQKLELEKYKQLLSTSKEKTQKCNQELAEANKEISILQNSNEEYSSEIKKLSTEIKKIELEKQKIQSEFENFKNGSKNLLNDAYKALKGKKWQKANSIFRAILENYPTSNEASLARKEILEIDKILKEEEKESKKKEALINIYTEYDEFKKRTFYHDKRGEKYMSEGDFNYGLKTKFNLYFSIEDGKTIPNGFRFNIGYQNSDWLFIKQVTFLIDGKTYTISSKWNRDHSGGTIWEYTDVTIDYDIRKILDAIIKGGSTKVRFSGTQYTKDFEIEEEQKLAIENILNLYKEKGGK